MSSVGWGDGALPIFTCTANCNGRMERNYTSHVECLRHVTSMRSRIQTVIEAICGQTRYKVRPMNLSCDDVVSKLYICIDKRNAIDRIAIELCVYY